MYASRIKSQQENESDFYFVEIKVSVSSLNALENLKLFEDKNFTRKQNKTRTQKQKCGFILRKKSFNLDFECIRETETVGG